MKVSTRGRYGLRAMVDLAENEAGAIPLRMISERQKISEQYLEQLFANLRRAGLVKSVRGAHGGYMLKKTPQQITAGDIIRALEGPLVLVDCVQEEAENCNMMGDCVTHPVWQKLQDSIEEVLDSITLDELKQDAIDLHRKK